MATLSSFSCLNSHIFSWFWKLFFVPRFDCSVVCLFEILLALWCIPFSMCFLVLCYINFIFRGAFNMLNVSQNPVTWNKILINFLLIFFSLHFYIVFTLWYRWRCPPNATERWCIQMHNAAVWLPSYRSAWAL